MALRLYTDKDSGNGAVVAGLRRAGIDVLTTSEAGNDRLSDPEQLEFAAKSGRAIYTGNLHDFPTLHSAWIVSEKSHAGIILRYHQRTPTGQQLRGLLQICASLPDGAEDRLEVLEDWLRDAEPE